MRIAPRSTDDVRRGARGPLHPRAALDGSDVGGRYLALAEPVLHPLHLCADGPLAAFAGLRRAAVRRVARGASHVVIDCGDAPVRVGQCLDPSRAAALASRHPGLVTATHSAALEALWRTLDLDPHTPDAPTRDAARRFALRRAWIAAHGPAPRTLRLGALPIPSPRDASPALLRRLDAVRRANAALRRRRDDATRRALLDAVHAAWNTRLRDLRARTFHTLRTAPRIATCVPDPGVHLDAVGVPLDLARALLGRRVHDHLVASGRAMDLLDAVDLLDVDPAAARDAVEALLPGHPVLLVREGATSPWHVAALRPVLRGDALALHPARLSHLCADEDRALSPLYALMPFDAGSRAALSARVGEAPSLPPARTELARWRDGDTSLDAADLSLCADDLRAAPDRAAILDEAAAQYREVFAQFDEGLITELERHNKQVDIWCAAAERAHGAWQAQYPRDGAHPLRTLERAGAVSSAAVRAMVSTRGVYTRPDGTCREVAALRALADGVTPHEFFMASAGARRGEMARRARETRSDELLGSLARRLEDVRVTEAACRPAEGVTIARGDDTTRFARRLQGRVALVDVVDPTRQTLLARANAVIDDAAAGAIDASPLDVVVVRSPARCAARHGVCVACAGPLDPRERHAGLAAALRIGHVARSMTLRTFHIGC